MFQLSPFREKKNGIKKEKKIVTYSIMKGRKVEKCVAIIMYINRPSKSKIRGWMYMKVVQKGFSLYFSFLHPNFFLCIKMEIISRFLKFSDRAFLWNLILFNFLLDFKEKKCFYLMKKKYISRWSDVRMQRVEKGKEKNSIFMRKTQ